MARARFLSCGVAVAAVLVAAGCGTGRGPQAFPAAGPRAPGTHGFLTGVSCRGPVRCVAVGDYFRPGPRSALIERWDGTRWATVRSPLPPAHTTASLDGISCPGASDCTAVGRLVAMSRQPTTRPLADRALIEHWNGTAWSTMKSPNSPAASRVLAAVACPSTSACIAVGATSTDPRGLDSRTLAERWDGSRWAILKTPDPAGASYSFLSAASCTSGSSCVAVGEYFPGGRHRNRNHVLIERWNGHAWTLTRGPGLPGSVGSYLSAVSCSRESDCMAVGTVLYPHRKNSSNGGSREHTLAERWNGKSWRRVASLDPPGPPADRLSGVTCSSIRDCIAVGTGGRRTPPGRADGAATLAERWNGTAWAIMKTPSPSANSDFSQIACLTPARCMAVGGYGNLGSRKGPHALTERWNGSTWSLLPS